MHKNKFSFKPLKSVISIALALFTLAATFPAVVHAEDTGEKLIALTFDDGPGPYTDELIDALDAIGAKATFFMLGSQIESYPDTLKKMYESGHEIANHSWSHPYLPKLSYEEIEKQIMDTNKLLEKVDGEAYHLLRCPYGASNEDTENIVNDYIVHWTVDTKDWDNRDADFVKNAALSAAFDGAIILAHDIYKTSADGMVSAAKELVKQGYTLVTVSELAARRGLELNNGDTIYDAQNKGITLPASEDSSKEEAIGRAYVKATSFLRSTEDGSSSLRGILPAGTTVDVIKQEDKSYKIRSDFGASGFMRSSNLEMVEGENYPAYESKAASRVLAPKNSSYSVPALIKEGTDLYSSKKGGSSLAKLPLGSSVTIVEDSDENTVMVTTAGGISGYVNTKYLDLKRFGTGRHAEEKNKTGVEYDPGKSGLAISTVNLRTSPSESSSILSVVKKGTALTVTEKLKNNWCKVSTETGDEGYVKTYCLGSGELVQGSVTADVNFRGAPSGDGKIINLILTGTSVTLLGKAKDGWQMVLTGNSSLGYISADFIKTNK